MLIQYSVILVTLNEQAHMLNIQIESFSMIISMAEDIECSLHSINQRVQVKENRIEMVKAMRNIVEFHSKAIQLSQISSQIFYSPID